MKQSSLGSQVRKPRHCRCHWHRCCRWNQTTLSV
jgi:hypothetical protein